MLRQRQGVKAGAFSLLHFKDGIIARLRAYPTQRSFNSIGVSGADITLNAIFKDRFFPLAGFNRRATNNTLSPWGIGLNTQLFSSHSFSLSQEPLNIIANNKNFVKKNGVKISAT
jgi:hypothetical protein